MKKFLLSTGLSTTNKAEYIKDAIFLNLTILRDEVPYFEGGCEELVSTTFQDEILDSARYQINEIVSRIKNLVNDIEIEVESVELSKDFRTIVISVKVDGNIQIYEI